MYLTRFRNCKPIEIPAEQIVGIEEGMERTVERDYPYSDLEVRDKKDRSGYRIRVVESKKYILKEMEKEGCSLYEQNH